ncbi:MAG: hypothetical protein WKF91_02385 [Segetibacter sp.]
MKSFYLLLSSFIFVSASFGNYFTPGTGVRWTLDNLVTNSGGDVTLTSGTYNVNDTVFISAKDTLFITSNAIVKFAVNTYLDVNGTLIINPPTGVTFTAMDTTAGYFGVRIDSSNATVLRKLTFEYAVSLRLGDSNITIDSCTFRYNTPTAIFGNSAITLFRSSPFITNCKFNDNMRAAIQGGANIANAPRIIGNLFCGNNTLNLNVPQINLGATGNDTVRIMNNQMLRASTNSGGIGFLPVGTANAVISGNVIKNNRYGITFNGGSNINSLISYNQIDSNNIQGDPLLGGSGIAYSGGSATSQQNSIVTGNLIRWNLWGITIQGRSRPNIGNINNADTTDDGKNEFINNTNTATPNIDLYNNSVDTIYAQNNYWGTTDIAITETRIFHQTDNHSLGPVIYLPVMQSTLPAELTCFTANINKNSVTLNWKTLSESNSGYFNVERSTDGQLFNVAGTVAASGTASSVQAYGFTDNIILYSGRPVFYRLKIVDKNGTFKYSRVLSVRLNDPLETQVVKLYPLVISASRGLTAEIVSVKEQNLVIQFIDAEGRQIAQTIKALTAGKNRFTITTSAALQNGWIYLRFIGEGLHQTTPIFKHK